MILSETGCHFSGSCSSESLSWRPHAATCSGGAMNSGPTGSLHVLRHDAIDLGLRGGIE